MIDIIIAGILMSAQCARSTGSAVDPVSGMWL